MLKDPSSLSIKQQQDWPKALRQYETLLDLAGDCLFIWDSEGCVTFWNSAAERCYGWSKAESQGQSLQALLGSQWPLPWAEIQAVCLAGDRWSGRVLQTCREGTQIWVETTICIAQDDPEAAPTFLQCDRLPSATLATNDAAQVNQVLQHRATELETLFDVIPVCLAIAQDPLCEKIRINPAFANLLAIDYATHSSMTRAAAQAQALYQVLHQGEPVPVDELPMRRAITEGIEIRDAEIDIRRRDGKIFNLFGYAAPVRDGHGEITGAVSAFLDVTSLKRAEANLKTALAKNQLILESITDAFIALDPDWRYTYVNPAAAQRLRRSPDQLLGKTIWQTFPGLNNTFLGQALQRAAAEQNAIALETPYPPWQNWAEVHIYPSKEGITLYFQDVTARKTAERTLRESEERLRLAVDLTELGLWDWNLSTGKVTWSYHHGRLFGTTTEAFDGTYDAFLRCVHPDDHEGVNQGVQAALESGVFGHEFRVVWPDGSLHWLGSKGKVTYDEQKIPRRMLGFVWDISDRKQVEAEREQLLIRERQAREDAEMANRIKDEFLAVLSHELRSPLNPILGWTNLLLRRQLNPETTRRALETIERNAQLQTQLISDLLDVSRILRGKLKLDNNPVDLAQVVQSALETVQLSAEAKDIDIKLDLPEVSPRVRGDAGRLQQVVWNLLSNAVKFTPTQGEVSVWLRQVEQQAEIRVQDTGQGITADFLPYVFDYFRQADGATTRQFGGLGLGLAIVRHLTELHGGSVEASSTGLGQGATFTVRLPLLHQPLMTVPAVSVTATRKVPKLSHQLMGKQVLVVDDDAEALYLVSYVLEEYGVQVLSATSAEAALVILDQIRPHCLICDIGMPGIDGYDLMRQIRARSPEQGGEIPAIALTAYASSRDRQLALAAGFQAHLTKPTNLDQLIETLDHLLRV
ncbi:hybrid sensor histidine kinase/response regulator [Almyronema epifaneia]|uniref:histidine kinase n=1 Tax=Almyronema epifaneia S1 TaxID=2991925 RepID=A0ABW6IEQ0_9CYAN